MRNPFSSPNLLIAYKLPNPDDSQQDRGATEEESPTQPPPNPPSLARRLLGAARRISPRARRSQCEEEQMVPIPAAYNGLYEVLRDFDLLNVEDIEDSEQALKIRRRAEPLQPLHAKRKMNKLELRAHGIVTLTPKIGSLTYLHTLDLSDNHLTFLPETIGKLTFLERLGLAGNDLQFLPDSIGDLKYLRSIDLARNHLSTLPESFGKLKRLRKLLLGHNYMTALPPCITQLPKLTYLFVENNYNLKTLPGKICHLPRLHFIEVMGCDMMITAEQVQAYDQAHSDTGTPSLYEWCLRHLLLGAPEILAENVPKHIQRQVREDVQVCDFCNGPYFWHSVTRCRILNHPDDTICMEYKMCREHWKDEKSRVRHLFHEELEPVHSDDWKPTDYGNAFQMSRQQPARRFIIETPVS